MLPFLHTLTYPRFHMRGTVPRQTMEALKARGQSGTRSPPFMFAHCILFQ